MEDFLRTENFHYPPLKVFLPPTHHPSPHHQHGGIRARRVANLNGDRDPSLGSACGDAGIDLQNSLHQSRGGSSVKHFSGLVVDKNLYRKKSFRIRQVRSNLAILTWRIRLSRARGV